MWLAGALRPTRDQRSLHRWSHESWSRHGVQQCAQRHHLVGIPSVQLCAARVLAEALNRPTLSPGPGRAGGALQQ